MTTKVLEDSFENACVVCFKNVNFYSIGDCDHPVCYECSTRMRVLCRQNECPICRQDMTKVVFTDTVRPFKDLKNGTYLIDKKFQICFHTSEIQRAYNSLLAHVCSKCPGRHVFQNFNNLRDHMRREHELFYCDLCVDNLKILTFERRCYTRQELGQHRRHGDPDDKSHKGHPLCEFCDKRYMDNDELYRHLRREHLFCHFCDADGYHRYYNSYGYLRDHFRKEHYLCEEGDCYEEKFTPAFRTEIDLKAHKASVHSRSMGKAAAKQARTLELEFTLAPRPREYRNQGRSQKNTRQHLEFRDEDEGAVGGMIFNCNTTPSSQINTDCIDQFPSLGNNTVPQSRPSSRKTSGLTIRAGVAGGLAVTDENFPALGPETTLSLRVNSLGTGDRPISSIVTSKPANVSIHVNHRPNSSAVTTRVSSSQNSRHKEKDPFPSLTEAFPSLSNTKLSAPVLASSTKWSSGKEIDSKLTVLKNKPQTPSQERPTQATAFHIEDDFPSLSSQFNTSCNVKQETKPPDLKGKKASSISIPVFNNHSSIGKETNGNISSDSDSGLKKSTQKKKKKRVSKNSSNSNNSSGNETKSTASNKKGSKNKSNIEKDKRQKQDYKNETKIITKSQEHQKTEIPTQRKISELKIGELIKQPTPESKLIDLLISGDKAPPGFTGIKKPPPGFESTTSCATPPPGFSITVNSVARPPSNGLTFTSSSGQSYPITPDSNMQSSKYRTFLPPTNFSKRNFDLVDKVMAVLKKPEEMDFFRQISFAFRQNNISVQSYYSHCEDLMGSKVFDSIFPELIVLLPDIQKQKELWSVYQESNRQLSSKSDLKLEHCIVCEQIISKSDRSQHATNHMLDSDYPAL
uniref:RING-type E3 ubiquitin transferase n=1 Tax=Clastoptera arizonana TaxID=38151 RepID=A0A1B6CPU3_9HEMI